MLFRSRGAHLAEDGGFAGERFVERRLNPVLADSIAVDEAEQGRGERRPFDILHREVRSTAVLADFLSQAAGLLLAQGR